MADIIHYFPISAPRSQVFAAISTPEGLDTWWTKRSAENRSQELNGNYTSVPITIGRQRFRAAFCRLNSSCNLPKRMKIGREPASASCWKKRTA